MTESQITSTSGETAQLGKGLQVRHLTMMGLGSAIGAGLFLGTGVGIKAAGPGVLVSYVIAGFIVVLLHLCRDGLWFLGWLCPRLALLVHAHHGARR